MPAAKFALSDDDDDVPSVRAASPVASSSATPAPAPRVADDRPAIIQLAHAWLNERGAPELQPWPGALVDEVLDQLQQQQVRRALTQQIVDSLQSDAATSEEEHFRLNVVQLDAERSRWLLRSFLRARIVKVRGRLI